MPCDPRRMPGITAISLILTCRPYASDHWPGSLSLWMRAVFTEDVQPSEYMEAHGLKTVNDTGLLEMTVAEVLAANPNTVEEYKSGKTKVLGFLVGQVMKQL